MQSSYLPPPVTWLCKIQHEKSVPRIHSDTRPKASLDVQCAIEEIELFAERNALAFRVWGVACECYYFLGKKKGTIVFAHFRLLKRKGVYLVVEILR